MVDERFPMRLGLPYRPLQLIGVVRRRNCYVELSEATLRIRFGFFENREISRREIRCASQASWPWWGYLTGRYAILGSRKGVVELHLRRPLRIRGVHFSSIAVSLEDPERFLSALAVPQPAEAIA